MKYSDFLVGIIRHSFSNIHYFRTEYDTHPDILSNKVFDKYLVVNVDKDCFEVPVFCSYNVFCDISKKITNNTEDTIYKCHHYSIAIPLVQGYMISKSIFDKIFESIENFSRNCRILTVKTNKNEIYYGNSGFICDSEFTPLIVMSYQCHIEEDNIFIIDKILCNVSTSNFINSDKLIQKGIIKRVIPAIIENNMGLELNDNPFLATNEFIVKAGQPKVPIEIIIKDTSDYLSNIICNYNPFSINNSIKQCAKDNIDEIINEL